jgi:hypothetical protein
MKKAVLIFLIALSSTARADDKQGQRNVYDEFGEWLKPSAGVTVDEQVTARIKRHMANLLYPVDMSSFVGPDKDGKFRDLIMALQKQIGVPATGILTSEQFDRLAEASRDIDAPLIASSPGKYVSMSKDGNLVIAAGTGAADDLAEPINRVHIVCDKPDRSCMYRQAELDLRTQMLQMLDLTDFISYEIKTWTPSRVTAIREHPCGTVTMTIDVNSQTVTIITVPHADLASCMEERPGIWTLVDGGPVAQKLNRDRINKARALVYEPARKLVPLEK